MKISRLTYIRMMCRRIGPQGIAGLLLALTVALSPGVSSAADEALEAKQLVEKAQMTLESFMADNEIQAIRDLMGKAKGVFIAPQVLKGAFVVGVSGGSGVLLARGQSPNKWSGPAFYTIGSVSFGLQAGGEASEIILLVMTDRGISALLGNNIKLGADASVALGPVGAGVGGATAALSADIIAFSRAKGLYGGISVDGAIMAVRDEWNRAFYGKAVQPSDILVHQSVSSPQAAGLVAAVAKAASTKP